MKPILYRPDIDGLRAAAILLVLFYHAFPRVLPGGYLGVDVFFVISGYLITAICMSELKSGAFSTLDFYNRRAVRILPALILVLVSTWLLGLALLPADDFQRLGKHIFSSAFFFSNFMLLSESGYFDLSSLYKPLLHLWSLAIEEQFYLLWPLVLAIFLRFKASIFKIALMVLILSSLVLNIVLKHYNPEMAFYFTPSRFWEILIGVFVAQQKIPSIDSPRRAYLSAVAVVLILLSLFMTSRFIPVAIFSTCGTGLLIYLQGGTAVHRLLSWRPLVYIGRISYPLYLWHWPLLSFAYIVYPSEVPIAVVFSILVSTFVLAALTNSMVEKPVKIWMLYLQKKSRYGPIGVALLFLSVVGLAGFATSRGNFLTSEQLKSKPLIDHYSQYSITWKCFVDADFGLQDLPKECVEKIGSSKVFVWGDSYSAHTIQGLEKFFYMHNSSFSVAHLSASLCPPILGINVPGRRSCREFNDFVFQNLQRVPPDVVILIANWKMALGYLPKQAPFDGLLATVEKLEGLGARVFVVGQFPMWQRPLYKLAAQALTTSGYIPDYFPRESIAENVFNAEEKLVESFGSHNSEFIPLLPHFCNHQGCTTYIESSGLKELQTYDLGHLTKPASEFVGHLIGSRVLSKQK